MLQEFGFKAFAMLLVNRRKGLSTLLLGISIDLGFNTY